MDDAFEALDDPSDDMEEEVEAEVDKVLFELTQGKKTYLLLAQPLLMINLWATLILMKEKYCQMYVNLIFMPAIWPHYLPR